MEPGREDWTPPPPLPPWWNSRSSLSPRFPGANHPKRSIIELVKDRKSPRGMEMRAASAWEYLLRADREGWLAIDAIAIEGSCLCVHKDAAAGNLKAAPITGFDAVPRGEVGKRTSSRWGIHSYEVIADSIYSIATQMTVGVQDSLAISSMLYLSVLGILYWLIL